MQNDKFLHFLVGYFIKQVFSGLYCIFIAGIYLLQLQT